MLFSISLRSGGGCSALIQPREGDAVLVGWMRLSAELGGDAAEAP